MENSPATNDQQKQALIETLPNEVIYNIFNFLTTLDVVRGFTQLNHRFDVLVRFHVKEIDLTDSWQGNQQYLQRICETIQTLKIDRYHTYLLTSSCDRTKLTARQHNDKHLLQSMIQKIATTIQCSSFRSAPASIYRFPALQSLHLINISNWNSIISDMNLTNLNLWFDDGIHYFNAETKIPATIIRFTANAVLDAHCFHLNLIYLNVYICSFVHLIEIVEHTPNIQHLSISFANHFSDYDSMENYQSNHFQTMIVNFCSLTSLTHLSFSTKQSHIIESNEYFPFEQIQRFIDQCCPTQTILKKVILKFDCVNFSQTMWSTIVRYKTIFDHFHFYASFRLEDKSWKNTIISSLVNQFDFYIEDGDPLHAQIRFIHVYSLPFIFNKLHGFISCEELSTRSSFSSVRHLYFIQTRLARHISFASLANRMPRLMSMDCNLFFAHSHRMNIPEVLVNRDNFIYIRIFRYVSHCWYRECDCHDFLPRFLPLMPHLHDLTTSEENFIDGQHLFPTIKRLDLRQSRFELFDNLIRYIPHLSKIFLGVLPSNSRNLSYFLNSLFIKISSLELVSFNNNVQCNAKVQSYKSAQHVLVLTKRMDNRLRHLKLDYRCGIVAFYLQNM